MANGVPRRVSDPAEWQALVDAHPGASILQTAAWGDFKARWGWRVRRLAWGQAAPGAVGQCDGVVAQVLLRPLPATPWRLAYVAHGPLVPREAPVSVWQAVLADLGLWARGERVGVLKVELNEPTTRTDVASVLRQAGWRPAHETIQFPNTMVSDLSVGKDALWAALKPKTRYNIGLAERRGVAVRAAGRAGVDAFWRLYEETGLRDGFALRERAYYVDWWTRVVEEGRGEVLLAEKDGAALAGALPVSQGGTAFYMYGASATEGRRDMPAFAAQWAAVAWAAERGCAVYDWWGGPTRLDEGDPLWGVYRVKTGFGAHLVERLGGWDLPVSWPAYLGYRLSTGARRKGWLGGRGRTGAAPPPRA